jgi:hypothetical protein
MTGTLLPTGLLFRVAMEHSGAKQMRASSLESKRLAREDYILKTRMVKLGVRSGPMISFRENHRIIMIKIIH